MKFIGTRYVFIKNYLTWYSVIVGVVLVAVTIFDISERTVRGCEETGKGVSSIIDPEDGTKYQICSALVV